MNSSANKSAPVNKPSATKESPDSEKESPGNESDAGFSSETEIACFTSLTQLKRQICGVID